MAKKSAGKSAGGRPFSKGNDPRRGRGPKPGAPNAGRPPNEFREKMASVLDRSQALAVVEEIISGDIHEELGMDRNGEPIVGITKNRDRLAAIEFAAGYAYGKPESMDEGAGKNLVIRLVNERPARRAS